MRWRVGVYNDRVDALSKSIVNRDDKAFMPIAISISACGTQFFSLEDVRPQCEYKKHIKIYVVSTNRASELGQTSDREQDDFNVSAICQNLW